MTNKHNPHSVCSYKRCCIAAAVSTALASSLITTSAFAQGTETQPAQTAEEIIVTGSRLARSGFETPSPVTVIGNADIRASTAVVLGDLLNELPQLRSTFGLSNSGRFIGTAGVGQLDLRGLGTDRTLVLVNGRRHVSASEGETTVDVNSIPTDMIERIEIITGANSAVYGADAITGVVNFILKDDFEGTNVRSSYGEAGDSGFSRASFALTAGRNFDDDRGNAIFSIGYERQDRLLAGERGGKFVLGLGQVANPADTDFINAAGRQVDDGIPDDITVTNQGFWAISNAGTSLGLGGALNPDGSFSPVPFGQFEFTDGLECGGVGCTALDLDTFDTLQVGLERFTLDANFRYNLTDSYEWYFEGRYANVDGEQQGQPSFDFGNFIPVQRDNAFVSPSFAAAMDAAGVTSTDLRRFNIDLGIRQELNNRETFRAVTGIRGDLGRGFELDAFINYGRTTVERVNLNNRIDERFAAAVDAIQIDATQAAALVASGLDPNAEAGDIACRSTVQEAQGTTTGLPDFAFNGCVPLNVLGINQASPEAIDFINSTALGLAEIQQVQFQAVVSNPELIEAWAGPISAVAGVEFREERSFVRGDSLSALGNTFFNALSDTRGRYDVSEVFGEVGVPLLTDAPGAQELTFEGAVRYSDYSSIGETVTWETRLNWQPYDDLRVRFNYGEALRAPNIDDLFSPPGENFRDVDDPCDMMNLDLGSAGRNTRIANCQALGIADPTTFDSLDESSINAVLGGNPSLNEEEAETFTLGVIYTPGWAPNLRMSLDYWDIEITEAIAITDAQSILDRCVDDPNGINNQFCALVTRDGVGNIAQLRQFPLNLNTLITKGYDFEVDYRLELGEFGTLSNRLVGSYLDQRDLVLSSEDNVDEVAGELGDPLWQVNFRSSLFFGDWEVFAEARWIDNMFTEEQELLFGSAVNMDPNPDVNDITITPSMTYVDLGVTYSFGNGVSIGATVDNVFDRDPPFDFLGNGEGSGIYDNIGRFYLARLTWDLGAR